jgi:hypothetical protein
LDPARLAILYDTLERRHCIFLMPGYSCISFT